LKKYAEKCDHITELGVRGVVSTWAFLAGKPKKLVSVDIAQCPVDLAKQLADKEGIEFEFILMNDLLLDLEETDLLFIDTFHTGPHLKAELKLHADKARKYIIMHDTETFGTVGNDGVSKGLEYAIVGFLCNNVNWILKEKLTNNNGLTVLERLA